MQDLTELARKTGFIPYQELTEEQKNVLSKYVTKWYMDLPFPFNAAWYWWKQDGENWISFDVNPGIRVSDVYNCLDA